MAKWDLSQECRWFNIRKSINVIHYINRIKDKNHMIISEDAGKAFDKIQHSFMIKKKKTNKLGMKGNFPTLIKSIYITRTANIIIRMTKCFAPKIRKKTIMSTLTISIQIVLEVLDRVIRQEKEIKGTQIGKEEVKLFSQTT